MLKKQTLMACLLALIFTNCHKENLNSDSSRSLIAAPSAQLLATSGESVGYILMGTKVNSKVNQIRQKIAELGGNETGFIAQLNLMFVSSANSNFVTTMEALGITVGNDFKIKKPQMATQKIPHSASSTTLGNTNPEFPFQWNLQAISAPQAWALGYKGRGVRVAVLDEGFYMNDLDLAANINVALSHNFVTVPGQNNPSDPSFTLSGFSHATHVAGIIAALDNNISIVGVAPEAEIMAIKVLPDGVDGDVSAVIKGIVYAADNGADVINLSLGTTYLKGTFFAQRDIKPYNDAIQYATSKGVTVICGAGNDALDFDHSSGATEVFPASSPHALCISATGPLNWYNSWQQNLTTNLDIPASYSNFGSSRIDLAAPGGSSDSYPNPNWFYDRVLSLGDAEYNYWASGTSMAAPHVSGVAALIIGKNGGSMSPSAVKSKLKNSADDLGKPGRDPNFGDGRVNAYRAVQ
jgi:lantibiotic leader peptide-processing serine protease